MQCRCFLFDLDGTLVDSLPVVERSWCHWADRHGIDHQDVLNFIHGKQAITSLRHFLAGRSEDEIQAEFKYLEHIEATDTDGITALPGARELLEHLNEAQIPWAIVTSGSVPVAHARHKAAGLPTPDVFITAERVKRGKPEPDAFFAGCRTAGHPPGGVRGGGRCGSGCAGRVERWQPRYRRQRTGRFSPAGRGGLCAQYADRA